MTPGGDRAITVITLCYVAAYVALAVAGLQVFIVKTMVVPAFVLYATIQHPARRQRFLIDWLPFLGAVVLFDSCRGAAYRLVEDGVLPASGAYAIAIDRWMFGVASVVTTVQTTLAHPALDRLGLVVHGSHFLFFLLFGLFVWQARPTEFWRYRRTLLTVMFVGLAGYYVLPTIPPWLAAEQGMLDPVRHVTAEAYASVPQLYQAFDTNPVAAMPSLHAAFPAACAVLAWRLFGTVPGLLVSLYACTVFVAVVYLGEHYVVDVIAGVAVGLLALSTTALGPSASRSQSMTTAAATGSAMVLLAVLLGLWATG